MNIIPSEGNKVSVIIPTFNREKYISEAIQSVLLQTYPVYEIIVVDDGSTDNTRKIIEKYGASIKYVYQQHKGPSSARNTGLRIAKGNYIAFLDSDDIWVKNKISMQLGFFKRYPNIDFVFAHQALFSDKQNYEQAEILNEEVNNYFCKNYNKLEYAFEYLIAEYIIPIGTVMFKSSCLDKVGFFDENLYCAEDFDYFLRFAYHYKLGFINRVLMKRRMHSDNVIHNYLLRQKSKLKVLNDLPRLYPKLPNSTKMAIRKAIWKVHMEIGYYYYKKRDFDNALLFLRGAFPRYFLNWKYDVKIISSFLLSENIRLSPKWTLNRLKEIGIKRRNAA